MSVEVRSTLQSTNRVLHTPAGTLDYREAILTDGQRRVQPLAFMTADQRAAVTFDRGNPRITLSCARGSRLVLSAHGAVLPRNGRRKPTLDPYSPKVLKRIGELLRADKTLQASVFTLSAGLRAGLYQATHASGALLDRQLTEALVEIGKRRVGFAQRPARLSCSVERVTRAIEREVVTWVDVVLTAAEQAQRCAGSCSDSFALWDPRLALCLAGCAFDSFVDVVVGTVRVVETIVEQVIIETIHCTPLSSGNFPTFDGLVPVDHAVVKAAEQPAPPGGGAGGSLIPKEIGDLIGCLAKADWKVTTLGNLKVDVPVIDMTPVTLTACFDRDCSDKLKTALLTLGVGPVVQALTQAMPEAEAIVKAIVGDAALAALTTILGVANAAAAAKVLIAVLLSLAIHAVILGGQMALWDSFDMAPGGFCIHHPTFPLLAVASLHGILGLWVAGNTPFIAEPR